MIDLLPQMVIRSVSGIDENAPVSKQNPINIHLRQTRAQRCFLSLENKGFSRQDAFPEIVRANYGRTMIRKRELKVSAQTLDAIFNAAQTNKTYNRNGTGTCSHAR